MRLFAVTTSHKGTLFSSRDEAEATFIESAVPSAQAGAHGLAFAGLYAFILLLYLRPQELFPGLFSLLPIVRIVGVGTLIAYFSSKLSRGERITRWPLELRMVVFIWLLGWLLLPLAASPADSLAELTDSFFKVLTTFLLLVNLLDTRERLWSVIRLVVWCGSLIALDVIRSFVIGQLRMKGERVAGIVGGIFGNPNDLATALNLLVPLALVLALNARGLKRQVYLGLTALMSAATIVTFSRGGFLGLLVMGSCLLWKLGRRQRIKSALTGALAVFLFLMLMPGGYGKRLLTIFNNEADVTGSAQERRQVMERAAELALHHPVIGLGIGNFPIYSIHQKKAHNAYLEIAAELGLAGLLAYLTLILAPLRSLRRIERRTAAQTEARSREYFLLSAGLQAAFFAYMVCSIFASIQYLWFLYFPVAYALALRRLQEADGANAARESKPECAPGALWTESRECFEEKPCWQN
ncbi:MAG TPA: O-antigen ligase family protein [Blastocatellia bacterium]|nr:O-antigen ligase family protein [Blastocatellia bacterium]